jgi:uncharacterized protein YcbX
MISVSALYIYPIKSCRGMEVRAFRLDDLGPQFDRRFMLVDVHGQSITQREEARLALVTPTLQPTTLSVRAEGMKPLKLPLTLREEGRVVEVVIGDQRSPALDAGSDAREWFSEWLGRECRLVYMPNAHVRPVAPEYSREPAFTAFSDGFPEQLVSSASVSDLSARAKVSLSPERFRPSIVVTGCDAYAEDSWRELRIGGLRFDVIKPVARNEMLNIDQTTARSAMEPLATLSGYRGSAFGQHLVHRDLGNVRVGDTVEVVSAQ